MNLSTVDVGVALAAGLFGLGLYALLAVRNLIKLVIALQIMVKAAVVGLAAAGAASGQAALGESLAVTVIVVDTLVAVVALALAVQVRKQWGTLDVGELGRMQG